MRTESVDISNTLNANSTGNAYPARDMTDCTVEIDGTLTSGTVHVKGRIGSAAWVSLGSTTTSPALISWTKSVTEIMVDLTGVTQTGLTANFCAKNTRAD